MDVHAALLGPQLYHVLSKTKLKKSDDVNAPVSNPYMGNRCERLGQFMLTSVFIVGW